jgi:DNA-binding NtrC family response regulator
MAFTILIVDDEAKARGPIARMLKAEGYDILEAESLATAVATLKDHSADMLILDFVLPDGHGLDLLRKLSATRPKPQVVVVTGTADVRTAVEALHLGAADLLEKPVDMDRLKAVIRRCCEVVRMQRELDFYQQSARAEAMDWVMGETPVMQSVLREARRAAATSTPVLVTGQTGTGKDVLARAIHMMGPRAAKPFIPVNCAALPADVIESELFGHEAGAFTDAAKRKPGMVEAADGGVLFLDEIGTLRLDLQSKLLRFLDDHTFRRVGGLSELTTDVLVIAATNRDLPALVRAGEFREDLYYRLKVADLHMPTLAERREDIPALVGLFVRKYNQRTGMSLEGVTPRALAALTAHDWPGNIRELRYVVERAAMMCEGEQIDLCDLPSEFATAEEGTAAPEKPALNKKK